jgi:hypothetical protein
MNLYTLPMIGNALGPEISSNFLQLFQHNWREDTQNSRHFVLTAELQHLSFPLHTKIIVFHDRYMTIYEQYFEISSNLKRSRISAVSCSCGDEFTLGNKFVPSSCKQALTQFILKPNIVSGHTQDTSVQWSLQIITSGMAGSSGNLNWRR